MTDWIEYAFWLGSRAAGIVAYLLLSASILGGLALAMKLVPPKGRARVGKLHQRVALIALGMIALHGVLLLGDSWLNPTITQLLVPFTMGYEPVFTGLGIIAFYVAAVLALSFFARRRIGARRWRNAHRFTPVAWALASVHVIGAGSDASSLWMLIPLLATIGGLGAMVVLRWTTRPTPPPRPPVPAREPRAKVPA